MMIMDGLQEIIVGNVCSLCACVTDSISGTRKKRNQILGIQMISQIFYAAGSIILKGYSSTAQNAVAILRNFAAMKNLRHKSIEWILIGLGVSLGVFGIWLNRNAHGWLDWLPIAGNLEYSIAMFRFRENDRALKIAFIVNMIMFAVFNFAIRNYVGGASCLVVMITTFVFLVRGRKAKDEEDAEEQEETPAPNP